MDNLMAQTFEMEHCVFKFDICGIDESITIPSDCKIISFNSSLHGLETEGKLYCYVFLDV